MSKQSLEDVIQAAGNPVTLLRNQQTGPNVYPGVPPEYTNWRDETQAWQKTCVLFNQSYHMADLLVEGPDALKLLSRLGVNSFNGYAVDKAKQFVPVNYDGYVIGDVILFYLAENHFNLVGRIPGTQLDPVPRGHRKLRRQGHARRAFGGAAGPVQPQGVSLPASGPERDEGAGEGDQRQGAGAQVLQHGPRHHRRQTGARASARNGGPARIRAVRTVRRARPDSRRDLQGRRGIRATTGGRPRLPANTLESGWIPSPLPAVYTGEKMKSYRQWLSGDSYEAKASIGGSFVSSSIEDYYLTPWDLGYGPHVKFDHDFIGREALEQRAKGPHRTKVTLALNTDDVMHVLGSQFQRDHRAKFMEFPSAVYSMHPQ